MLYSLPSAVTAVLCTQSIVLTVKGSSAATCNILFYVFVGKQRAPFKRKDAVLWFLVSTASEGLVS